MSDRNQINRIKDSGLFPEDHIEEINSDLLAHIEELEKEAEQNAKELIIQTESFTNNQLNLAFSIA